MEGRSRNCSCCQIAFARFSKKATKVFIISVGVDPAKLAATLTVEQVVPDIFINKRNEIDKNSA